MHMRMLVCRHCVSHHLHFLWSHSVLKARKESSTEPSFPSAQTHVEMYKYDACGDLHMYPGADKQWMKRMNRLKAKRKKKKQHRNAVIKDEGVGKKGENKDKRDSGII